LGLGFRGGTRVGVGFRVRARARGRAAAVLAHHDSAAVA
jgi:hypothetical protein